MYCPMLALIFYEKKVERKFIDIFGLKVTLKMYLKIYREKPSKKNIGMPPNNNAIPYGIKKAP